MLLPVNVGGVVTNAIVASLDLNVLSQGVEGVWYVGLADANGVPVFAIGIRKLDGKIYLTEYSVSGTLSPSFYTQNADVEFSLEIKLYPTEGEAQIFVNEKCVAISSVFYGEDALERKAENIIISAESGDSIMTVDNVRCESTYAVYESHSDIYDSFEDNSTKLTFEDSMNHRITSLVTSIYSTSAKTRIEEFIIKGTRSKALTFGTGAGGNDELRIGITERYSGYTKVVFDADIYTDFISCTSGKPQYHIFFETASGIAYQFRIVLEDGRITFRDHDNTSQGANVQSTISPNEWFNLRIVIELGDADEFKAYCYVNGTKLFESNHYYGKGEGDSPYELVERVRFYTMSAMTADISFDNIVFAQADKIDEPPVGGDDNDDSVAEILPVKGGASGIVVLMHDDGDLVSASLLDSIYKKYSIRGNVSLIVDRVYNVTTSTADQSKVTSWQNLLDGGRWQITSHSKTHDWWGTDNSDGKITDEVVNSQAILRELFPGQNVLTFAYPGFSAYEGTYTQNEIYGIAKDLVSQYYISGRYFGDSGAFDFGDTEWEFVIAESIGQNYLDKTLSTIDDAANGKMAVIFMHNVCQDTANVPSQTVTYSHMSAIAEKISGYVKDGKVWNAFYEDAVLYVREAESANLTVGNNDGAITLCVTDDLPDDIYNYPLTVRVNVPSSYEAVKVVQGESVNYYACKNIDGKWVADVDVVPNGTQAFVTEAELSDVPKEDENEDLVDGGVIDFENSSLGSDVAINGDASVAVSGSTSQNFDKTVTEDPTGADNKVFGAVADAITSNTHIYVDRSSDDSESGSYYIFSAKVYLDDSMNGSLLPATTSFATIDFRIKGTSNIFYTVNLRRLRTNKDTPSESRGLAFTPKGDFATYLNKNDIIAYNTWVDLTIQLYIDHEKGTATASFFVGENHIATEVSSFSSALNGEVPTRVDIKYISGTSSISYFDDVNFVRSDSPFIESDNEGGAGDVEDGDDGQGGTEGGDIPTPGAPETSEFDVIDFETSETTSVNGGVNMSLSTTTDPNFTALIESLNGNNVLAVSNNSGSNRHVRFDFDTSKGNNSGGYYTVKMKLYISSEGAENDKNFADMDFRTTNGALLYTARFFFNVSKDGAVTVSLKSNSKTDSYGVFASGIATDKWIDFEMVCFCYNNDAGENAVDADVFVDGVRFGGHKGLTIAGASTPITVDIERFNIKTIGNVPSRFYIDDIVFARTEAPLIEESED